VYLLTRYYPCFGCPFLRDLSEAIKICEADCDIEIIKTVWDCAEAMLRLWYSVIWDYAETVVRCCRLRWVAIILGNGGNGLGKMKNRNGARLEIPQTVIVLLYR